MKKNTSLITLLCLFCGLNSFATIDTIWTKVMGGSGNEPYGYFHEMAVYIDKNDKNDLFIASSTTSEDIWVNDFKGAIDSWVIKLNEKGDTLWTKVIGGESTEISTDILALDDGGCLLVGFTFSNSGDLTGHHGMTYFSDGFIVRLDSTGEIVWSKQYGGGEQYSVNSNGDSALVTKGNDRLHEIIENADGDFVAVGNAFTNGGDIPENNALYLTGWILKIDGSGKLLYSDKAVSATHTNMNSNDLFDIVELSDGSGYITMGHTSYWPPITKFWVSKYDKSFNKIWEKEYGSDYDNLPSSITETEFGNLVFTGYIQDGRGDVNEPYLGGVMDIWVTKINGEGEILKQRVIGGSGSEIPYSIRSDNKGNIVLVATINSKDSFAYGVNYGYSDFWIVSMNHDLDINWSFVFGGQSGEALTDVVPSDDGSFLYCVGKSNSDSIYLKENYGASDLFICKLNNPAPRNAYVICGDSISLLSGVNPAYQYKWSPATGLNNQNSGKAMASPLSNVTYQLTITDDNSNTITDSVMIWIDELKMDLGEDIKLFCNDSIMITPRVNISNTLLYQWSPVYNIIDSNSINPIVFPDTSVNYTLKVTAPNGCASTDELMVYKDNPVEICMIATPGKLNTIVWERDTTKSIDSIFVYRETNQPGTYERIGARGYKELFSAFADGTADYHKANKYKIATYSCDSVLGFSEPHKTLLLNARFSNDTNWNLQWGNYEGLDFEEVEIYRGTNESNMKLLKRVFNTVNTFRDPDPIYGDVYYRVAVARDDICHNGYKDNGYNISKSNIVHVYVENNYEKMKENIVGSLPKTNDIYYESFDNTDFMPSDITLFDGDGLTPKRGISFVDSAWVNYVSDSSHHFAISTSYYIENGMSDDWLILPKISLSENPILSWKARIYNPDFKEKYEVRISTNSLKVEDFKDVVSVVEDEKYGWVTRVVNLKESGYLNQDVYIAFRAVSAAAYVLALDDIKVFTADTNADMSVVSAEMEENILLGEIINVKGVLVNYGAKDVTNFTLNWTDGSSVKSSIINNVELSAFEEYKYTLTPSWTPLSEGVYDFKVWVSDINGKEDANHSNDTLIKSVLVLKDYPVKKVLLEEATGAWCGYCPDGAVKMLELVDNNENIIGVALHNGDAMATSDADVITGTYISGFPSGLIDRYKFESNSTVSVDRLAWKDFITERLKEKVPVSVIATNNYDKTTRELLIDIEVEFMGNYIGDVRLNCFIVEDSVSGTGSGYDQSNYYSGDDTHEMFDKGDPIIDYQHRHVLREMLGGAWGTDSIVPDTVKAGSKYNYQYKFVLSPDYDENQISLIAIAQNFDEKEVFNREILNVSEHNLIYTGIQDLSFNEDFKMTVFPNPVIDVVNVTCVSDDDKLYFSIYDNLGKNVKNIKIDNLKKSEYCKYEINVQDLSNGIYNLELKNNQYSVIKRISIIR